jgi:hypothetical protein
MVGAVIAPVCPGDLRRDECSLNVVLGVGKSCLAFRDFSSLTTHFRPAYCTRLLYVTMAHVKNKPKLNLTVRCKETQFAIVNITRVIATAHITFVIAVWRAKKQNPPREVLGNYR